MNTTLTSIQSAILALTLTSAASLSTYSHPNVQTADTAFASQAVPQVMAFTDTAEATKLRKAYIILATGDHDYKGHRVSAMEEVKAAANLLGLDLSGDAKDKQPQQLSDEKMREAKEMITQVLDAAAVKDQKHIAKHLREAVHQINVALDIK